MAKLLLTGDIHIHDFPDHNLGGQGWRLEQFRRLAHRYVEIAKEYNCEYFIAAGDIVHRHVLTPGVANTLRYMVETLSEAFPKDKFLYISGNHDSGSKSQEQGYNDAGIHAIMYDKATYMDNQVLTIGNRKIGFSNWRPDQTHYDFKEHLDLLVGHITLHDKFGQEFDSSVADLILAGDIHNIVDMGNAHSINVPFQHYMGESIDGSVIVLDTDTMAWERVKTETADTKFLKIMYKGDKRYDPTHPYTVLVEKPKVVTSADTAKVIAGLDIDKVIEENVKALNLSDLHAQYAPNIDRSNTEPADLDFVPVSIRIKNFRSIESFEYQFTEGLTVVTGENGNGKSSLLRAIDFVFRPPRSVNNLIRKGCKDMEVSMTLYYKGEKHTITRGHNGSGFVEYFINDVQEQANNSTELNQRIQAKLPFIRLMDLLYREQGAPYLLSGYGYNERIAIVSEMLGLGLISNFHVALKAELTNKKSAVKGLESEIHIASQTVENLQMVDLDKRLALAEKQQQADKLTADRSVLTKLIQALSSRSQIEAQIESHESFLAKMKADVDPNFNPTQTADDWKSAIETSTNLIASYKSYITKAGNVLSQAANDVRFAQLAVAAAKEAEDNLKDSCPTCGKPLDSHEEILNELKTKTKQAEEAVVEKQNALADAQKKADEEATKYEALIAEEEARNQRLREELAAYSTQIKLRNDITGAEVRIQSLKEQLNGLPDPVKFPSVGELQDRLNAMDIEQQSLARQIAECEFAQRQYDQLQSLRDKLVELNAQLDTATQGLPRLEQYMNLFASNGAVVQSVFTKIAEIMTSGNFVVRTVKQLAKGDLKIDFDVDMQVDGLLIPYADLSGGQKVLADLFFLTKLFELGSKTGLVILDESLKELSENRLEEAAKMLKGSRIGSLLLSTHVSGFNFYDRRLQAVMSKNVSNYTVEGIS